MQINNISNQNPYNQFIRDLQTGEIKIKNDPSFDLKEIGILDDACRLDLTPLAMGINDVLFFDDKEMDRIFDEPKTFLENYSKLYLQRQENIKKIITDNKEFKPYEKSIMNLANKIHNIDIKDRMIVKSNSIKGNLEGLQSLSNISRNRLDEYLGNKEITNIPNKNFQISQETIYSDLNKIFDNFVGHLKSEGKIDYIEISQGTEYINYDDVLVLEELSSQIIKYDVETAYDIFKAKVEDSDKTSVVKTLYAKNEALLNNIKIKLEEYRNTHNHIKDLLLSFDMSSMFRSYGVKSL